MGAGEYGTRVVCLLVVNIADSFGVIDCFSDARNMCILVLQNVV
jgi:hypothetical protein